MTWLIVLIFLTYCLTVGFTAKYKEQSIEYREKMLEQQAEFDYEIMILLYSNNQYKSQLRDNGIYVEEE